MNESALKKALEKKLNSVKDKKGIYVFVSSPQQYNLVNSFILSYYTQKEKKTGIYVTLNKGYKFVIRSLEEQGCDAHKLYFIDGITKTQGKEEKADNCTFISAPEALTELSLAISTATNTGRFEFLFLDSVNTILIYNDLKTTERFTHYIITKLREANISGIIFSLEEESANKLTPIITQFCDDCIYTKDMG